jgi:ATP-dependent DNA helicase RecG
MPGSSWSDVPGIGPARAAALAAAGFAAPQDVLLRAPRPLPPPPAWCDDGPLPRGAPTRVRGRVLQAKTGFLPGRGKLLNVKLERTDGHAFAARFFRAAFLQRRFVPGEWFDIEGRTDGKRADLLNHPSFAHCPQGAQTPRAADTGLRLAWTMPEGFADKAWSQLLDACLARDDLADPLGELGSAAWRAVLHDLHRPPDAAAFEAARRAVAARECLALAWHLRRRRGADVARTPWRWDDGIHARVLARLPFALTPGQEAALAEIRAGLRSGTADARLLAGDVGSGKTALALAASLAVIADGAQAAWLAPTAVLAAQHARFAARCLQDSRVRVGLLTGGTPRDERARLLAEAADGSLHLLIGTHALLEPEVAFARLGLAVIDEQHRFGTAQRAALVAKSPAGTRADLLLATATPIPRTLALTAYGDLAVTRISGRPPGRTAAATTIGPFAGWEALGRVLAAEPGRSFVVCPRIEGDEDEAPLSVDEAAAAARTALGDTSVAVLTGAMREAGKLAALAAFAEGRARCLVATTVVEVGVDVPEATLAVVLDAQRFGLASLHQLRGRVGRGTAPGRCLLLTRGDAARLAPLTAEPDGLAIAESDLAERGPGELLGLRQHGGFRLLATDLARDLDLLQAAHARVRTGGGMPPGLDAFVRDGAPGRLLLGG